MSVRSTAAFTGQHAHNSSAARDFLRSIKQSCTKLEIIYN